MNRRDSEDLFDSILRQEERSYEDGVREGTEAGEMQGFAEGFTFGSSKGWEIGAEIGFYKGYASVSADFLSTSETGHSPESTNRKVQAAKQIVELADALTLDNVKADSLSDNIIHLRRRFRQVFPGVYKVDETNGHSTTF